MRCKEACLEPALESGSRPCAPLLRPPCPVVSDSVTPWTVARQAPLSMGFSRQGHWRGLPFPLPGDLPNPGIEPRSPAWWVDTVKPIWKVWCSNICYVCILSTLVLGDFEESLEQLWDLKG